VRRRPNPDDGRSFLFELSARGDREWRRGWGALQRIDARLEQTLDRDQMRAALTTLGEAFERALTEL
jgi:DNA-binding MarR family transcriptional regulator